VFKQINIPKENNFMAEKTCAACDCDLDANSIKVKIGGKTVEVCCDECARKLKEAHASAAAPSEGRDIDEDKLAASVHDEQRRNTRPGAALLIGAIIIGFYLSAITPARADANARVMAFNQMPGQMPSQMSGQSPAVSAVAKDFDSGSLFMRDLLIIPGFQMFKEKIILGRITDSMADKTHREDGKLSSTRRSVHTASGRISYMEQGAGPVALFVHGVLLNGHLWRHQLAHLSDIRRCIAVDLLAHGDTEIAPDQDVSVTANANMLKEFLDALKIEQVDLVGNDSGGGIAQIFAASYPERVRSLTLTDCDAHDNWPPESFKPFLAMAAAGGLRGTLDAMLADKSVYRSPQALGPAYEHPERLTDDSIEKYLRPLVRSEQRTRDLQRFLAAFDNKHTLAVEARLKTLKAPTLIVWGTDDVYFDVKWSRWLADTIPGTRRRVELKGARIFFPEERWAEFNKELRAHWQAAQRETQ
jgi:pimeloyl-ACP methyl ester carboxylesterase